MLLLQPPGACREFTRSGSCYPPLGLCQIAAMAGAGDVKVLDADGLRLTYEQTVAEIDRFNPVAIGMTLTSYTFEMIEKYTAPLKEKGYRIIVGGPQASLDPDGTLNKLPSVDWVFRGEPELQVREIINRLRDGDPLHGIEGVCCRVSHGRHHICDMVSVDELSMLPYPSMDGLPVSSYWCPDAKRIPMVTVITTKGCPHKCGFCASPALLGRKIRKWTPQQVVDQLVVLSEEFGIKEISFVDDVFTINKGRLSEICEGIIRKKIDISWFCNSRADQLTLESAKLAKKAGCHQMYLGIESGDPRILSLINKGATVEQLETGAGILKAAGIDRSVGFVVGLPTEDDKSVAESIKLAHRIQPERIQFTRWTPLVASPLYEKTNGVGQTFHRGGDEQVKCWIAKMYESVKDESWGAASW
ncbi:MAG: B12-binding domain-containing radical SAM protein [Gammaproteobacteria bacterium]